MGRETYTGLNRSLILLFLNYVEIIFCFSILYLPGWFGETIALSGCGNALHSPWQSFYFSVVTITTLGYGDFEPITNWSRFLVILEVLVGLFVVLLIFGDFIQRTYSYTHKQPPGRNAERGRTDMRP